MYEPYLNALSRFLYMEVPPWILAQEITDNWKTSAWGRISGIAGSDNSRKPTTTPTDVPCPAVLRAAKLALFYARSVTCAFLRLKIRVL